MDAASDRPPFIGVLSDTHSYYDDQLDELLAGAAHIVHAGDVGTIDVLARLRELAPVTPVMGNTDVPYWDDLPMEAQVEALGLRILVGHIARDLLDHHDPVAEGFDLVVTGHSHKAAQEWRGDTLVLNPGSAGKARFGQPRTCALVTVGPDGRPQARIVSLG